MEMLQRPLELYQKGGFAEVRDGIIRFSQIKRRKFLYLIFDHTPNPKESLRHYLEFRKRLQPASYTNADPFKLIYINPSEVSYYVSNVPTAWGKVVGGDWEHSSFSEITVHGARFHESNVMHFIEGVPWDQTPIYHARLRGLEQNQRRFILEEDVKAHFHQLDILYRDMKENGYKTQNELLREVPKSTMMTNNDELHPTLNEVGLNIDQDGKLLWSRCGRHRLSIAKILNLDQIPVQVRTRHTSWEKIRRELDETSDTEKLSDEALARLDHPDMADLLPLNGT